MWGRSKAVAGIATVSLIVGCGGAEEHTPRPEASRATAPTTTITTMTPTNSYAWLTTVLPNDRELTDAAGFQVRVDEPPSVGIRLRNTVAGSRELTEKQCLGVISPFEQQVYGAAPLRAVTYATESSVTFGAAAVDSPEDARELIDAFAGQWRECEGKALVKDDGAYTYEHRITQVDTTADVVSAIDEVTSDAPTGSRFTASEHWVLPRQRAT